ncbi:MAG: LacI family DNA-binding transcriptional regulator [Christensenellales bacterium]|jgi:LacI family transcriptional regulator
MAATIKDVSKASNVSIATVSKVLNGDYSKVSEETKQRVLNEAKRLQYRPNLLARSLVRRRSSMLGLVIPDIANPYYADMCRGMADEAQRHKLSTLISNTDRQQQSELSATRTMIDYAVAGVALVGIFKNVTDYIELLDQYDVPYVLVDHHEEGLDYCVYVDDYLGSYEAVTYLISCEHRTIAYISGFPEPGHPRDFRLAGYRQALMDAGLSYDPFLVENGRFNLETGYQKAATLLQRNKDITAIACGNDMIALGAFRALREVGYRIPQDISLVGFDDVYLSTVMEPRMTTVRQPAYELGIAAVKMLAKRISKEPLEEKNICFKPVLIKRDTVAPRRR